jgi:ribosome biogenesis GTPase / thiamine phosphate phosphatase
MNFHDIKKLWGFHPLQEAYYLQLKEENSLLTPGRVVAASHEIFRVKLMEFGVEIDAKVRGHFYQEGSSDWPVVGDWVLIEKQPGDHQFWPIESVLPRRATLKRGHESGRTEILAANLDYIALVTSFNMDLNEKRIDRGVAMIQESGAIPLIVMNKADLVSTEQQQDVLQAVQQRFSEIAVLACSAEKNWQVDPLKQQLKSGETIAFLGMSGVGKSTLVNRLLTEELAHTQGIRENDSRGKHTTTHRELFMVDQKFWILDSPGIREFSFAGDEEHLDQSFSDITDYFAECRFRDCSHQTEVGCAVQQALLQGEISEDRWKSYLKMKREIEFQEMKNDKKYRSEQKKHWAKLTSSVRKREK